MTRQIGKVQARVKSVTRINSLKKSRGVKKSKVGMDTAGSPFIRRTRSQGSTVLGALSTASEGCKLRSGRKLLGKRVAAQSKPSKTPSLTSNASQQFSLEASSNHALYASTAGDNPPSKICPHRRMPAPTQQKLDKVCRPKRCGKVGTSPASFPLESSTHQRDLSTLKRIPQKTPAAIKTSKEVKEREKQVKNKGKTEVTNFNNTATRKRKTPQRFLKRKFPCESAKVRKMRIASLLRGSGSQRPTSSDANEATPAPTEPPSPPPQPETMEQKQTYEISKMYICRMPGIAYKRTDAEPGTSYSVNRQNQPVWRCFVCGVKEKEECRMDMICCESCQDWYHTGCVGVLKPMEEDHPWFCKGCIVTHFPESAFTDFPKLFGKPHRK